MSGLLLIDKPAGMTSHDVVRRVRRLCKTRKVGHSGTLDPLATGLLPVAVGQCTKILQFLTAEEKSYAATFRLGCETATLDAEGEITRTRQVPLLSQQEIEKACSQFRGDLQQVPPLYSAIKMDGVPLYKLARQGQTVELVPRPVSIYRLQLLSVELPDVSVEVDCSKGTYIRSLVRDLGEALGCGAHLIALRRLSSGLLRIADSVTLEQLEQLPQTELPFLSLDEALAAYPALQVLNGAAEGLCFGISPGLEDIAETKNLQEGELVRLQISGQLAAMARFVPEERREKRGDFDLIRVFVGQ